MNHSGYKEAGDAPASAADDFLWPRLACVECGAPLHQAGAATECPECHTVYSSANGIPLLLPQGAPNGFDGIPDAVVEELFLREEGEHFLFWGRRVLLERLVAGHMSRRGPLRVLDVGCGTGYPALSLRSQGVDIVGIDLSTVALDHARTRDFERLYGASAQRLPFAGEQFDLVICLDVLEHLEDDIVAMREALRVLEPGGKYIVFVPALRALWSPVDDAVRHKRRYRRRELRERLQQAGFEVRLITGFLMAFLPAALVVRVAHRLLAPANEDLQAAISEYALPPRLLNAVLKQVVRVEAEIASRLGLPIGVSLAAVAEKPREGAR